MPLSRKQLGRCLPPRFKNRSCGARASNEMEALNGVGGLLPLRALSCLEARRGRGRPGSLSGSVYWRWRWTDEMR